MNSIKKMMLSGALGCLISGRFFPPTRKPLLARHSSLSRKQGKTQKLLHELCGPRNRPHLSI